MAISDQKLYPSPPPNVPPLRWLNTVSLALTLCLVNADNACQHVLKDCENQHMTLIKAILHFMWIKPL